MANISVLMTRVASQMFDTGFIVVRSIDNFKLHVDGYTSHLLIYNKKSLFHYFIHQSGWALCSKAASIFMILPLVLAKLNVIWLYDVICNDI